MLYSCWLDQRSFSSHIILVWLLILAYCSLFNIGAIMLRPDIYYHSLSCRTLVELVRKIPVMNREKFHSRLVSSAVPPTCLYINKEEKQIVRVTDDRCPRHREGKGQKKWSNAFSKIVSLRSHVKTISFSHNQWVNLAIIPKNDVMTSFQVADVNNTTGR